MPRPEVPFAEAVRAFLRIGLESFGGPAGQIAVMHRVLVEERRWLSERRFLHALNFCMLLPGPEAMQLATYAGWLFHGARGGLVAGLLFVLPGFVCVGALAWIYAAWHELGPVASVFAGLQPAVLAIVVQALLRIARRALRGPLAWALAALAFAALFLFGVPFPLVVLGAGLAGLAAGRLLPPRADEPEADEEELAPPVAPSLARTLRVLATGLALWLLPLAALRAAEGPDGPFTTIGLFFSKCAVVTFGGAYAVLAYVAQEAVATHGWLAPGEMLDGLGLAETTPGPLVLVVEFVGFLGGWRDGAQAHGLSPALGGVLAALLVGWVTFVPCFLWIFLGAPWIEALRGKRALASALSAITAAVVGVIANLAVWFAVHVVFERVVERAFGPLRLTVPELASVDPWALAIAALALVLALRFRVGILPLLATAAALGLALSLLGLR